jgi:uracil-DNA glycosylase family 4
MLNIRGANCSPYCAQCPCARNGKPTRPVPAFGGTGGLCIVGEAPGKQESMQGFPFIGPSGQVINKALRQVGGDRGLVFVVNALVCQRPQSDNDFDFAVECCRERLRDDLELARPTAICALGGTAMKALQLPVRFVSQARGTVQETPLLPGTPVIGALHPAALLHGGAGEMTSGGKQKMNVDAQAQFLFSDIAKALRIAKGEVPPMWSDDIAVVSEPGEVQVALEAIIVDIYEAGFLGLDLEWTCDGSKNALDALGAGADRALISLVGIGCGTRSVSFTWAALVASGEMERLQQIMEDENLSKLAHNKQADKAVWEAQVGPIFGRFDDSMLMHHAAFPGIDHDLQQVASQFLCVPPWKVDHAKRAAEWEAKQKEEAKVEKVKEKEVKKAARVAEHERKNAEKAAEAAERKAKRQAEHAARNDALAADKKARKAAKKAGAPAVLPGQLPLPLTSDTGPSMAEEQTEWRWADNQGGVEP